MAVVERQRFVNRPGVNLRECPTPGPETPTVSTRVTIAPEDVKNIHVAERLLSNMLRQINDQSPPHLLQGRFNTNGDVRELKAELHNAEAEVGAALRLLVQMKSAIIAIPEAK